MENVRPGGRELNCQRKRVESGTDLAYGGNVRVIELEVGLDGAGSLDEEGDRVVFGERFGWRRTVAAVVVTVGILLLNAPP